MGLIKKEFIDKLLDRIIIQDVIADFVVLKKVGVNFQGKSPFVEERTPSFVVSPVKQIWKDFSSGKGGTALGFLMEFNKFTYPEAIEYLARKYSEEIEYEDPEIALIKKEALDKKEKIRPVLQSTLRQYQDQLNKLTDDHAALLEIQKRGYSKDIIIEWGIGYAPENIIYELLKNSARVNDGLALGLIREGRNKHHYDFYSNRLIYPIHDENGLLIGLAGRALSDTAKAKWINPTVEPSNVLYNKSKVWFGLHKAKSQARKKEEMYIVEGYNDVIAFQEFGLQNTVAPCGTSIAPNQIYILKRYCERVVLVMDPDNAGKAAMLKQIPIFLEHGFRADIIVLPDGDPDEFCRIHRENLAEIGLEERFKKDGVRKDGFLALMEANLVGDALDVSNGAKKLSEIISKIEDDTMQEIYSGWLSKESKITSATIKKWVKEFIDKKAESAKVETKTATKYELPKDVKIPLKDLKDDIVQYNLFMANNQIYMTLPISPDGVVRFSAISNFQIEILQHMNDEKFPMKLLRVKNIFDDEKIFDVPSDSINNPQSFEKIVTDQGNFRFDGNRTALQFLKRYLFDKMGNGRKIDVLGWQPDGQFWAWNNRILAIDGTEIPMDENGIFQYGGVHYYIPSANKIYRHSNLKYDAQKRFRMIESKIPMEVYFSKMREVHRDFAISAILFAMASLFQDIVVEKLNSFPLLFFYGPGSTGKDELSNIVQSFVGIPQVAINLEGNVSTIKAQVREFAQFRNGISHLSEYKRNNDQLDGVLKGLWDRRGYKKGNIESHIGTDSVPIESSAILTGNHYPTAEPLILRLIWNEMDKSQFDQEEMKRFDELKDMTLQGVSGYSHQILKHRQLFIDKFDSVQRALKVMLEQELPEARSRIISNLSVLTAVYMIFKDLIIFPFTQQEMFTHFKKGVEQQLRKISSSSVTTRFWEMFITSLRGHKDDRLQVGFIVSIETHKLYLQWTHTYAKIQRMWFAHYQEAAPSKTSLLDALEKLGVVAGRVDSHSFSSGRQANRSSAIVINLNALDETTKNDIVGSILFQMNQLVNENELGGLFGPPATPNEVKELGESEEPTF
ncbi:DNA primase [Flavobacterium sp. NKUCC04_CG]|uniref:DNA primase n=1 Tax=Flavobacterium sp. NKUCC04_CG TaxID=2842121 RepID=UPI001C5BBA00|nr:DNA primase [Flavobacterium sp. NKUCC04_CG]MBW3519534.1 DNA primase [Flavobacterium sp. NKUCC04_CG]